MLFSRIDLYKKELDKHRPFHEGHTLKSIQNYYRIGLTWTSNALEGSELTEADYIQKLERAHTDDRSFVKFIGKRVFEAEKNAATSQYPLST